MAEAKNPQEQPLPEGAKAVPSKGSSGGSNKVLIIVLAVVFVLFILPGILLTIFFVWLGSGDNAENLVETVVESSTGAEVEIDADRDGSITIESEDGSLSLGESEELPDGFPDDAPVYSSQTITSSFSSTQENTSTWSVTATSDDSVDEVAADLVQQFASEGWEQASTYSINSSKTYSYDKGDLTMTVTISDNNGETQISYNVVQESNQ